MRQLLAAGALALAIASPAAAGDFATYEALGFSPDGLKFAFEQFGVQDGSGFPYSEIFLVDLLSDRFVAPSPIRVRIDEDGADLEDARREARRSAASLLSELEPPSTSRVLAANAPTKLNADPYRMVFMPRAFEPSSDQPVELRLVLTPVPETPALCDGFGRTIAGFTLLQIEAVSGGAIRELHRDETVPESRNWPYDYRLAEVRSHPASGRAVVIVAVKSIGFEGPDIRYIAVPLDLGTRS